MKKEKKIETPKQKPLVFTQENYKKIKESIFEKNLQENDFLVNFFK